ncbi:leucine-rich repeat-containing protein 40-like isoform X2 [Linepithema humile]
MRNNLKSLKIMHYDLPELPLQITCLKNLTVLYMTSLRISSLPKEFGNLPLLELDLSNNDLGRSNQSAWEWLMQAPIRNSLRELNLSHNYITAIPLQIICLKNLHFLYLFKNKIKFIPKEFGILSQLIVLNLMDNLLGTCQHSTWEWLEMPIRDNLSLRHLNICGNFLTEFPLQITCLKNLQSLNISRNKINFLPKELGTLPHLLYLDLTSNYLGKYNCKAWEWLEQTEVRNKLIILYLSDNLLTVLPPQIGKLNALITLWLGGNKLKCLPQSLANLKNLIFLDLSNNDLLYLPGSVSHLNPYIYVDGNPFNLMIDDDSDDDTDDDSDDDSGDDLTTNLKVPSLVDCSAEVILKYGLDYTNYGLPEGLIRYMDNERHCFLCNNPCFRYYEKRFINYPEYYEILHFKFQGSSSIQKASFECYVCSSNCAEMLKN